ncbi:MAG: NADH-quinone oxidoreductase subunit M [Actinomycetota bacterium]|nr:NADH-quinone oxidoreductase subunit M [Actinomycetota bacterium]
MTSLVEALIIFPAVVALFLALLPKSSSKAITQSITTVAMVALLIAAAVIAVTFKAGFSGYQFVSSYSWIPAFGISWKMGVDGISLFLVVLTAVIFPIAYIGAGEKGNSKSFAAWLLLLEAACFGSFLSIDLFAFFVTFELTLIPAYFIIGSWGYEKSGPAAIKFFIYTFLGSALLLVGMLALVFIHASQGHPITFDITKLTNTTMASSTEKWLFAAFTAAFAVKAPMFPFHTWSPDAYRQSPTAGVMVLAAVMAKLGTYGILRFDLSLFPHATIAFTPLILTLAVIGIIYGAIVAAGEKDVKRMLAYSSLSHMGFIILGIFGLTSIGAAGGVLQMINHGIYTAALFLLVGYLYAKTDIFDMSKMGGLQKKLPILAGIFTLFVMASVGLPGLSGFVGEFMILLGTFSGHRWWAVVGATGVILSAVYMLWSYQQIFHGSKEMALAEDSTSKSLDLSVRQISVLAPLVLLVVLVGVYPRPLLSRITPSVNALISHVDAAKNAPAAIAKLNVSGKVTH